MAIHVINVAAGSGKCIPVYTSDPLLATYNHDKRDIVRLGFSATVKAHNQIFREMTPCSFVCTKTRFEQTSSVFEMLWPAALSTSGTLVLNHPSKTKDVLTQAITLLTFEIPQNTA